MTMKPFTCFALFGLLWIAAPGAQAPDPKAVGPKAGAPAPDFSGTDQFDRPQTLASAMGPNGVMLVFYRSADW